MLKVVENRGAAAAIGLVLLVCSLFTIGLVPIAKADGVQSYQYTVRFGSPIFASGYALNMAISFTTSGLIGGTLVNIDPSNVTVLLAPTAGAPIGPGNVDSLVVSPLVSFSASDEYFDATFLYGIPCPASEQATICSARPFRWQRQDEYQAYFNQPIMGTGVYAIDDSVLTDATVGGDPLGESYAQYHNHEGSGGLGDSVSVLATPEPNTGILVGACLLCSTVIALWRRTA
jgi:hypothetical protein